MNNRKIQITDAKVGYRICDKVGVEGWSVS